MCEVNLPPSEAVLRSPTVDSVKWIAYRDRGFCGPASGAPDTPALAPRHWPPARAAPGVSACCHAPGCRTAPARTIFLDLLEFDQHVADADLVITSEGRLDEQTLQCKLPAAVALRAAPTPVVAVVDATTSATPP